MNGIGQDLRFFLRQMRRRPVWALSIVLVLALGISANTAMYAAFDAWVTRPLPFEAPDELVWVTSAQPRLNIDKRDIAAPALGDIRAEARTLEDAEAWDNAYFNIADASDPVRVLGARVSHGLFPMLGVEPMIGRHFVPEEDVPSARAQVVLIGHRLWQERYGADSNIVGREIRVDGTVHEIVGVMPEGFRFPSWSDVWTPLAVDITTPRAISARSKRSRASGPERRSPTRGPSSARWEASWRRAIPTRMWASRSRRGPFAIYGYPASSKSRSGRRSAPRSSFS